MPTQWFFYLPYAKTPYGLNANDRPKHWSTKAKATAKVRAEVMLLTRAAKVPALDRIRVDVLRIVATNRTRDEDNLAPLLKAIYDGIGSNRGVSARIVEDDAPEYMEKAGLKFAVISGRAPRFLVTITDLGGQ